MNETVQSGYSEVEGVNNLIERGNEMRVKFWDCTNQRYDYGWLGTCDVDTGRCNIVSDNGVNCLLVPWGLVQAWFLDD